MRFTKIKYDGAKVRIEYEVPRDDGRDATAYALVCVDSPLASFTDALLALREDVIGICELPPESADKLDVRGVSLTHTNDILGACITALKKLKASDAPLVLNTPHLPEEPYGDSPSLTMTKEMALRISILCDEASRYVDGERAQPSLFAEAEPVTVSVELRA